jgi:putative transcriptional regulator
VNGEGSTRGRLLVATPTLVDPNFHRTVVLMIEHNADGALGVVLNRPTATALTEILEAWGEHAIAPGVVFLGGPVETDGMIGVARAVVDLDPDHDHDDPPGTAGLWPGVVTVDLSGPPTDGLLERIRGLRAFVGYAGWGPGQVEGEIAEGAWFVVDRAPEDLWSARPGSLWSEVLRRQPGRIAQFAHAPTDPTVN